MNIKRIVASLVFLDFAALNGWAMYTAGWDGLLSFLETMGPWGYVAGADVLIALSLAAIWMWQDARSHGRSPYGFFALTALTGSLGPLLYIATSEASEAPLRGLSAPSGTTSNA